MPSAAEASSAAAGQELAEMSRESQPLLPVTHQQPSSPTAKVQKQQQPSSPTKAAAQEQQPAAPARVKSQELGQCRICLEEDALCSLETPCGCTGTQRHAHKECIQKWVNEKHHTTCEICDQPYKGSYVVPPQPPPAAGEPLTLVSPLGNLYLTVDPSDRRLLTDVYDEFDEGPQPTVSWCFSFMMFLLLMMFLQSAMPLSDQAAPGSGGATPPSSPAGAPTDPSSAAAAAGSAAVGLVAGLSLFFVWLLSKLILVVFPLLMVMRLAARAQEQAAAEAAAAATVPGLDGPVSRLDADDNPLAALIARLAAARAASAARGGNATAAAAAAPGSLVDLEMEVLQARRAALSRLGRDPTFWGSVAAAAAAAEPAAGTSSGSGSSSNAAGTPPAAAARAAAAAVSSEGEQPQQVEGEGVPPQHRTASLMALMRAIRGAALRRQGYEETGHADAATAAGSSSGESSSVTRVQHGVV